MLFVLAHPIMLFIWDSRFLKLLDIVNGPWRAKLAVISVIALLALAVTSIYRTRMHISYPVWQALHAALALIIVVTALLHVLLIGYYVDEKWEKALWIAYSAVFVWIGFWVRLIKPLQRMRRRLRVIEVREELGNCHTLVLEAVNPAAFGPKGLHFSPGQFAWILLGRSPFAMTYHPFSFASSAEHPEQICFTVRAFGAFTSGLHDVQAGPDGLSRWAVGRIHSGSPSGRRACPTGRRRRNHANAERAAHSRRSGRHPPALALLCRP